MDYISSKISISSNSNSIFSGCSKYLATASGAKLTIRDTTNFQIKHTVSCIDKIERIEFSPDNCYILCALYGRSTIQAFSIHDSSWNCRINENVAGLRYSCWTPDSKCILTASDFGIQLAIWSLVDNTTFLITSPKQGPSMLSFSDCGSLLAVAHRLDCKDYVAIYSCNSGNWEEINKFRVHSQDLVYIQWTPNCTNIIVIDCPLAYRLLVYTPTGQELVKYEAYENALGIRSIHFSPRLLLLPLESSMAGISIRMIYSNIIPYENSPSLLAVSSYDGLVRILYPGSWQVAHVLPMSHPKNMRPGFGGGDSSHEVIMTVEMVDGGEDSLSHSTAILPLTNRTTNVNKKKNTTATTSINTSTASTLSQSRHYINRNLKSLPKAPSSVDISGGSGLTTGNAKDRVGGRGLAWSGCGEWLASCDPEGVPRCLWIWKAVEGRLFTLLVQIESIVDLAWRPVTNSDTQNRVSTLAFCTGTSRVYFWSVLRGVEWWVLPDVQQSEQEQQQEGGKAFNIQSLKWSRDGSHLLLLDRLTCRCVHYESLQCQQGIVQQQQLEEEQQQQSLKSLDEESSEYNDANTENIPFVSNRG